MERRFRARPEALCGSLPPHCRRDAARECNQSSVGLARELARPAGAEMECVRKLFSRRQLLRLARAQCLWTDNTYYTGWNGESSVQVAKRLSAPNRSGT